MSARPWPTHRRVAWLLKYQRACDLQLERMLWAMFRTKPSTVRGARKKLERAGVIRCVGMTKDGRKKWTVAT